MDEKKVSSKQSTASGSDREEPSATLEHAQLLRLRDVLSMKFWHFGPGSAGFDGYSQGICFLGGIYPEGSHSSPVYAPRFLPGALRSYGFDHTPLSSETNQLQQTAVECLDYLLGLRLEGLVPVKKAITAASKVGIEPAWLDVAASDVKCARHLPIEMRSDDEVRKKISQSAKRAGGNARAEKNLKTRLINTRVKQEFEAMRSKGFPSEVCTSKGRPNAVSIATAINDLIGKDETVPGSDVSYVNTFAKHIRKWLKTAPAEN